MKPENCLNEKFDISIKLRDINEKVKKIDL